MIPGIVWTYDGSYRIVKLTFVSVVVRVAVAVCMTSLLSAIRREKERIRIVCSRGLSTGGLVVFLLSHLVFKI